MLEQRRAAAAAPYQVLVADSGVRSNRFYLRGFLESPYLFSRRDARRPYDGIKPALSKWMAPQQPSRRHIPATQNAKPLHRFRRIFRTSRNIPASGRKPRREQPFIKVQKCKNSFCHDLKFHWPRGRCICFCGRCSYGSCSCSNRAGPTGRRLPHHRLERPAYFLRNRHELRL